MILLLSRQLGQCIVAGWIPAWKGVYRSQSSLSGELVRYRKLSEPAFGDSLLMGGRK